MHGHAKSSDACVMCMYAYVCTCMRTCTPVHGQVVMTKHTSPTSERLHWEAARGRVRMLNEMLNALRNAESATSEFDLAMDEIAHAESSQSTGAHLGPHLGRLLVTMGLDLN